MVITRERERELLSGCLVSYFLCIDEDWQIIIIKKHTVLFITKMQMLHERYVASIYILHYILDHYYNT